MPFYSAMVIQIARYEVHVSAVHQVVRVGYDMRYVLYVPYFLACMAVSCLSAMVRDRSLCAVYLSAAAIHTLLNLSIHHHYTNWRR